MVRSLWEEGLPITKLDIKFFDKSVTPLLAHDPGPVPSASYLAILLPQQPQSPDRGDTETGTSGPPPDLQQDAGADI